MPRSHANAQLRLPIPFPCFLVFPCIATAMWYWYIYVVMRSFDVLLPCSSRTWLICFQSRCQLENKKSSFFTICSSLHSESKSYKTVQYLECKSMKEWLYHNVNLRGKNHLVNNFPCFYALLKNDLAFGVYGPVFFFFSWDFLALQGIALTATSDNKACSNVNKESSCLLSLSVGFSAGSWVGILTGANKILCRIYQFQFQRNTITYYIPMIGYTDTQNKTNISIHIYVGT